MFNYNGYTLEGQNILEVYEPGATPQNGHTLADIINAGYALSKGTNMTVSEVIFVPPTDPETVQNLFRSWLTMSGHTAYTMGVAKANGAATMSERDAYDYLGRNLFPHRDITAITITFHGKQHETGKYGVHVYAKGE